MVILIILISQIPFSRYLIGLLKGNVSIFDITANIRITNDLILGS